MVRAGGHMNQSLVPPKSRMCVDPCTWGVRPELAVEGIRIFLSVYFNGFDPLRQHMLYVKATHSNVSDAPQGAAVVAGRGCKHTAPLVVPHLRVQCDVCGGDGDMVVMVWWCGGGGGVVVVTWWWRGGGGSVVLNVVVVVVVVVVA